VLKGKVRRWLAQWDDVLAYCEAQPHGGGSGAVLVLLKSAVRCGNEVATELADWPERGA
jgi:DNA-nicking Smr family endonuclease